jgi:hypothetical protein
MFHGICHLGLPVLKSREFGCRDVAVRKVGKFPSAGPDFGIVVGGSGRHVISSKVGLATPFCFC